jgi:large subunit ribosomal protein L20
MPRVKRAVIHLKKRRAIRKATKGYMWGRKKTIRLGHTAILKAGNYAFAHRRDKKGDFRKLWNTRINAAVREQGLSYSKFINLLAKKKIQLDRKVLADLALNYPQVFVKIVQAVK